MTNLLELDGKDLEKELAKIIEKSKKESHYWSDKERQILKTLWEAKVPYTVMAKKLGRPLNGIDKQIRQLGLTRPTRKE